VWLGAGLKSEGKQEEGFGWVWLGAGLESEGKQEEGFGWGVVRCGT